MIVVYRNRVPTAGFHLHLKDRVRQFRKPAVPDVEGESFELNA